MGKNRAFTLLTFEPIYQNWGFWLKVRCYQVLLNIYLSDVVFISVAGAAAIKHLLTVINIHKEGSLGENTWKTLIKGEISHNCTNWQRLARVLMENILKSNKGSQLVSPEPRQAGAPRCSGWATKTKLEMNDLRKHETKLWSLEWSQIRFSLNFFPSFFLPQLRCWAAALRPALTHSSEIGINQNSIKVEYPGEKYFVIMLTKKSLLLSNSYF